MNTKARKLKRKFCFGLAFLGVLGICAGILGCGKREPAEDSVSVPVEIGEYINFGSNQGEEIESAFTDEEKEKIVLSTSEGFLEYIWIKW